MSMKWEDTISQHGIPGQVQTVDAGWLSNASHKLLTKIIHLLKVSSTAPEVNNYRASERLIPFHLFELATKRCL